MPITCNEYGNTKYEYLHTLEQTKRKAQEIAYYEWRDKFRKCGAPGITMVSSGRGSFGGNSKSQRWFAIHIGETQ